jgi:outer membrane receptor protein involved in Fe transport
MTKQNRYARVKPRWSFAASAILILCLAPGVSAQEAGGTILGVVIDPNGGVVSNATVTIKNVATDVERVVPTSDQGFYEAPHLTPGNYQITIGATGFASSIVRDVVLTVGERREVNVGLTLGQVTQSVTVSGGAIPDVQLASSTISDVVDSHTVVDLPLNGRDWTSLTQLEAGVAQVSTQKALGISNDRANRGLGSEVTIGGNRPQQNNYRLDGVSINDYASGAPGSIQGAVLGVDAVQEFTVVTSNAPADYGKTSGGVINAASRSGSNSFHGTAYEFLRNQVLDARNFFDKVKKPPFKRNQFGASAGGPIFKDHTFFFADYEGLRQSLSTTVVDTVPSQAARNGTFCSIPQPSCTTTQLPANANTDANGVDLLVKPYVAILPLPNGTLSPNGDTGAFSFVSKGITSEDFLTTRIDHKLSASDGLFGTYLFDRGQASSPDTYNFKKIGNRSRRHTFALEESHIFNPAVLNTARLGFNRTVSIAPTTLNAINPAASDTTLGFDPGQPVGLMNIGGITNFQGGLGALSEYQFHFNSFQIYDDLYWTRGRHSLKFGFYGERIQANQITQGVSPHGQYIFGGLQAFLQNLPTSFNTWLSAAKTPRDLRQTVLGGYIQDDYRIRPNLTLNLGLRYETASVPTETSNQLTTLVNVTDPAPKLGSPYFSNPTRRNFAPRVGFAWDPFRTGKTSIRGAFGIYDVLPLTYEFELLTLLAAPFAKAGNITFAAAGPTSCAAVRSGTNGCFPNGGFPNLNPSTLRQAFVEQNPHRNYVEQWSLNIQRQVLPTTTVIVGYIGSHGVHQPFHPDDMNDVQPVTLSSAGYLWPLPAVPPAINPRLNPSNGQISAVSWSASSTYHGLTVEGIKRLSHGVQIKGAYTFSKSIDTSSSTIAGDAFGNSVSSLPTFDPRLRRGLSDFDVRNVGVINAIWTISSPQSWSAAPKWFVSGWQLGGIFTGSSGLPLTALLGGDPLGTRAADLYAFPNRLPGCNTVNSNFKHSGLIYINTNCFTPPTAPSSLAAMCAPFSAPGVTPAGGTVSCKNLIGNTGRNTLIGPGIKDLDFSLFKNNPIHSISETFNVQFRWEVFNVANHANFAPPLPAARQIFAATGARISGAGVLTGTSTSSRQMQFALKFIW